MTDCRYCGSEVHGQNVLHLECIQERDRRYGTGECIRCSSTPLGDGIHHWCSSCNEDSEYKGYPGGSA